MSYLQREYEASLWFLKGTYLLSFSISFHQTTMPPPSKRSLASKIASKPLCCPVANSGCVKSSIAWPLVIPCETKDFMVSFSFLSNLNSPKGLTSFASICNPFSQKMLIPLDILRELLWSSLAMDEFVTTRRERDVAYLGKFWERWIRVVNGVGEEEMIWTAWLPSSASSSAVSGVLASGTAVGSGYARIRGRTGSAFSPSLCSDVIRDVALSIRD